MPWFGALYFYERHVIERLAPEEAGVLLLKGIGGRWIYIGETGNIRTRLLELLDGQNDCVARESPTDFAFEVIAAPDLREARQRQLAQKFNPACP